MRALSAHTEIPNSRVLWEQTYFKIFWRRYASIEPGRWRSRASSAVEVSWRIKILNTNLENCLRVGNVEACKIRVGICFQRCSYLLDKMQVWTTCLAFKKVVAVETLSGIKYISDVLFVPEINQSLLSVGQMMEKNYSLHFKDMKCTIFDPFGSKLMIVEMRGEKISSRVEANILACFSK